MKLNSNIKTDRIIEDLLGGTLGKGGAHLGPQGERRFAGDRRGSGLNGGVGPLLAFGSGSPDGAIFFFGQYNLLGRP